MHSKKKEKKPIQEADVGNIK